MGNPSVFYEVLIYLNSFFFGMFASCEISMGILKAINLRYDDIAILIKESIILVVLVILEAIHIVLGRKGALVDKNAYVIISVILIIPCLAGVIYLLFLQTYVLKLELCLCTLMIALHSAQIYSAVTFVYSSCKPITYD